MASMNLLVKKSLVFYIELRVRVFISLFAKCVCPFVAFCVWTLPLCLTVLLLKPYVNEVTWECKTHPIPHESCDLNFFQIIRSSQFSTNIYLLRYVFVEISLNSKNFVKHSLFKTLQKKGSGINRNEWDIDTARYH